MSYKDITYEELIQYCKDNKIDYLTKQKKPKAQTTLLKELSKLSIIETNNLELINETIDELKDSNEYIKNKQLISCLIKKCHNLLYSNAISGKKAQSDIMKILSIVALNSLIKDDNNHINIDKLIEENKIIITGDKLIKYKSYIVDNINLILLEQNIFNEWKKFITYFASKLFPMIINENDTIFNISNEYIFRDLIKILSTINDNISLSKDLPIICGDIYEYFLEYGGSGSGARELGQYFTPRGLINIILDDCKFNEMISKIKKPTIYDPCMGTGGMLSRAFISVSNIIPSNIYGSDYENDTFKIGQSSLSILTKLGNINITNCNSLLDIDKSYLFKDIKFDVIITNPPFGVSIKYKEVIKDKVPNYKEIYPIVTNNGTSLFIQMIMYKLKSDGITAIVLPDGELMSSNNTSNINMRKFILDNAKIIKIINVEGGVFQNTGIKTKVLIFQKGNFDNYNQEVEFVEINSNDIKILGKEKLNETYQFNISKKEEIKNYDIDIQIKTLGEVCEFQNGYSFKSTDYEKQNDTNIGILQIKSIQNGYIDENKITEYIKENKKYTSFEIYKEDILIGLTGTFKIGLYNLNKKSYLNQRVGKITSKTGIIQKYIYYWYLCCDIESEILKIAKGAAQANISTNDISNIKIPIPSIEQQKEIVKYLDLIYETNIKTSDQKIGEIKKLNENYLKITLNNNKKIEIKTLDEICDFCSKVLKLKSSDGLINGKYRFYSSSQTKEMYYNKFEFKDYHLILGRGGNPSIHYDKEFCISHDDVYVIKNKVNINLKYIYYYLYNNINIIQEHFNGSTIKHISKESIKTIKIPIPSLEKQKEIIEYLDFNNNLINNLNKEIENNKNQAKIFFDSFLSN